MLAYDYPLLSVFWTMLWFFIWIAWIMLLFRVIGDVFRSRDMGGFAKAMWLLFVVVVPFLGVFVYLIARGNDMAGRDRQEARARDAAFQDYVQDAAGTAGPADELVKLADARDRGLLTEAEFEQAKAKVLA